MNKIILRPDVINDCFSSKKNQKRGAKVFGVPVTKEIASFIDDVAPEAAKERFFSMFLGGNFEIISADDFFDEDNQILSEEGSL